MSAATFGRTIDIEPAVARAHHEFSPSKLNYLDACPGYKGTSGTSDAAEVGTMLHGVCQGIVEGWLKHPENDFLQFMEAELAVAKIDDSQKISVRQALTHTWRAMQFATEVHTEEKLTVFAPDGSVITGGYADVVVFTDFNMIYVDDWKFGLTQVKEAKTNLQGYAYALGAMQAAPGMMVTVRFIQPRIAWITDWTFQADEAAKLYTKITNTIIAAQAPNKALRPGDQCKYCAHAGTCTALLNQAALVAKSYHTLPDVPTFHGSQITDPTQMAKALWVARQIKPVVDSVEKAAREMSEQGYALEFESGGHLIGYEKKSMAGKRSLSSAPLVWDAVKDVMDINMFTGCVDVRMGDFEKLFAEAAVEKAKASGKKLTKKAATEELHKRLAEQGLVTRSAESFTLKQTTLQLENKNESNTQKSIGSSTIAGDGSDPQSRNPSLDACPRTDRDVPADARRIVVPTDHSCPSGGAD